MLVLPAATRYEQRGGGTSTTTERRVRFSPEIPGPADRRGARRVGDPGGDRPARRSTARARDAFAFADAQSVRDEMERVMPLYRGIGGAPPRRRLGPVRRPAALPRTASAPTAPTAAPASSPIAIAPTTRAPDEFVVTTRRGKQFNSMTQSDERRAHRHATAATPSSWRPRDAARLGLAEGRAARARLRARPLPRTLPDRARRPGHAPGLLARGQRAHRAPPRSRERRARLQRRRAAHRSTGPRFRGRSRRSNRKPGRSAVLTGRTQPRKRRPDPWTRPANARTARRPFAPRPPAAATAGAGSAASTRALAPRPPRAPRRRRRRRRRPSPRLAGRRRAARLHRADLLPPPRARRSTLRSGW